MGLANKCRVITGLHRNSHFTSIKEEVGDLQLWQSSDPVRGRGHHGKKSNWMINQRIMLARIANQGWASATFFLSFTWLTLEVKYELITFKCSLVYSCSLCLSFFCSVLVVSCRVAHQHMERMACVTMILLYGDPEGKVAFLVWYSIYKLNS